MGDVEISEAREEYEAPTIEDIPLRPGRADARGLQALASTVFGQHATDLLRRTVQHDGPVATHVVGGVGIRRRRLHARRRASPHCRRPCRAAGDPFPELDAARRVALLRPAGPPVVEADSWVAFRDGEVIKLCIKDGSRATPEAMRIELPRDGLAGRYFWLHDHDHPYPFQHPIDQLLVVHALGVAGGALMHAAAICGRDGALLVAGPSGAGKTTMSRAAAELGAPVLSDERTILRPAADGGWILGGTSWPGEVAGFAENRSVKLRGLILLEHADRDELDRAVAGTGAGAALSLPLSAAVWDPRGCALRSTTWSAWWARCPRTSIATRRVPSAARRLLAQVGGVA